QSQAFSNDGRLNATTFSAPTVNQKLGATFAWDFMNRLNTRTSTAEDRYWNYAYDAVGQVTRYGGYTNPAENCIGTNCRVTKIREELYSYDAAGNRTDRGAVLRTGSNRYTQFGGYTFEYDVEGNVTRKYKTGYDQRLTWNALGQLTSVTTNGVTISYGYDGLGRRVRRTENGQPRYFLYNGDDLLMEMTATGDPMRTYTYWGGVDNPHSVRVTTGGVNATYYYVTEHPGHVSGLLNEAGAVVAEYRYTPWGEIESATDPTGQPLRFMSREIDTATQLYYVRARWYDQTMARFLSEDPIGLGGGMNTYAYAGNDPVNRTDPSGLKPGGCPGPECLEPIVWYYCDWFIFDSVCLNRNPFDHNELQSEWLQYMVDESAKTTGPPALRARAERREAAAAAAARAARCTDAYYSLLINIGSDVIAFSLGGMVAKFGGALIGGTIKYMDGKIAEGIGHALVEEEGVHIVVETFDYSMRAMEGSHEAHHQGDKNYTLWELGKDLLPVVNSLEALGAWREACR
ncbi:MAG TPA: RHS repeat-associated core domain-containing protein, partial [Thermoanaerobaculia bacterium]|nr:RHS repeat-associated core domain-containing protein [Thermoanaerobaculia bacterium]